MKGRKVIVQDDNVEKALRKFKKKIAESGLLLALQKRQGYIKPSVQRKRERSQAKNVGKNIYVVKNFHQNNFNQNIIFFCEIVVK